MLVQLQGFSIIVLAGYGTFAVQDYNTQFRDYMEHSKYHSSPPSNQHLTTPISDQLPSLNLNHYHTTLLGFTTVASEEHILQAVHDENTQLQRHPHTTSTPVYYHRYLDHFYHAILQYLKKTLAPGWP